MTATVSRLRLAALALTCASLFSACDAPAPPPATAPPAEAPKAGETKAAEVHTLPPIKP